MSEFAAESQIVEAFPLFLNAADYICEETLLPEQSTRDESLVLFARALRARAARLESAVDWNESDFSAGGVTVH